MCDSSSSSSSSSSLSLAMGEGTRVHATLFPFPCSGHINPTLKMVELLHSRGVHVTFVNTEHNHERLLRRRGSGGALHGRDRFRFEAVPDGLRDKESRAGQHGEAVPVAVEELRRAAGGGCEEGGVGLVSFALDIAEDLGVPAFVHWGTSACGFACTLRLRLLWQRGYTPLKGPFCPASDHSVARA
uniref:Uncharacterized protein n=1 Tax=Oryza meridionalis TaxID=40149 RepID=A0A0E0CY97_9ORYZ